MVAQTPYVSLDPKSDQAWSDAYRAGWIELNRAMRRGEPWSGSERNVAFLQVEHDGHRGFVDVAPLVGLDGADDGRSSARMDVDFDGDDDIVVSNRTAPRLRILQNRMADGVPHLAVRLEGTQEGTICNRDGIGAVVFATPVAQTKTFEFVPGVSQRRTRTAGAGYLAQSSEWLRFAFGPSGGASDDASGRAKRVRLAVAWPNAGGELEEFGVVRLGRAFVLRQGAGSARAFTTPTAVELAPKELVTVEQGIAEKIRVVLPTQTSTPSLTVRSKSGQIGSIFGRTLRGPRGTGKPAVLVVWDSRDPVAIDALGDVAGLAERAAELEISYIAIDVATRASDEELDPLVTGATRLAAAGWTGDVLAAEGETKVILEEVIGWRLDRTDPPALPWSLLLDPNGRLYAMRRGTWSAGELESDMALLGVDAADRVAAAFWYGGRWLDAPGEVDLAGLQGRLERRGATAAVRELDLARVRTTVSKSEVDIQLGRSLLAQGKTDEAIEAFENAIAVEPESALAHRALAYALHLSERYDDAVIAWGRALAIDPTDVQTIANRALAAVAAGDLETARGDLNDLEVRGAEANGPRQAVESAIKAAESKGGGR